MAKFTVTVHLEFDSGMTESDVNHYVKSAILSECGHYPPEDPMHDLDRDSVKVKSQRVRSGD
jgi:hypothetical protein